MAGNAGYDEVNVSLPSGSYYVPILMVKDFQESRSGPVGRINSSNPSSGPSKVTATGRTEVMEAESHSVTEDNPHVDLNGHVTVSGN